ncbi:restriction endonuclease fold toxin-2 domain-containing protein [Kitasatospora sp. NRRL B-11411]|uniref:restriction endonuclease fold toxin-2 domain-containing protein n=1 Tax=Kitasatospora sp. NRRL B-11411 TaxID=1463822 RepID=UPI0012FF32A0|nr:restriction endonuclease fold toxin-2 domain-containing protein [Kitasatospora sp. NRRL B-11411]
MTGFHVDPSQMIVSSAGLTDLQAWAGQIHSGLVGSLDHAAGMAGDDDTGRAFAAKYDPAARSVVNALGRVYGQLGGTANGLYSMAMNYIRTDADVAESLMKPQELPKSSQPQCEQEPRTVQIPTAVGHQNWAVREIVSTFWPQGDPVKLRQAGQDWKRAAQLFSELGAEGDARISAVTSSSTAQAVDTMAANWAKVHDGCATSGPLLNTMQHVAYQLGEACESYASGIEDLRDTLEDLAATAATVAVAGVVLTVFTAGISDVAAAGGEAAIAVEAGAAAVALTTAIETSAEVAVLAEAAAIVDAAASALVPIAIAGGAALTLAAVSSPAAAAPGPTAPGSPFAAPGVGPLPRSPSSSFPVLPPAQQHDVRVWMAQLAADGRTSTSPGPIGKPKVDAQRAYELRVAGGTQYELYTTVPDPKRPDGQKTMNADGVRSEDGAAIDAKYVGQQKGCRSPLRLGNVDNVPDFVYESTMKSQSFEITKYGSAFQDPRNKVNHLEIITNDTKSAAYFGALMAAQNVPGETRVVP